MNNKDYIAKILQMNSWELLQYIINNPQDLTDPYYSDFRKAIFSRYNELKNSHAA